ncbi:MAG: hypothetical protein AB1736_02180 [Chloroflexota bacterium]
MTSVGGFALIAVAVMFLHVLLSAELFGVRVPMLRMPGRAQRAERRRPGLAVAITVVALVAIQLPVIGAVISPEKVAGDSGAAIASVEIVLAATWIGILLLKRRDSGPMSEE